MILSSVRSGRRSGERGQVVLQFVRVVGQRFQRLAGNDNRAGIVLRSDLHGWGSVGYLNFLFLDVDDQGDIEFLSLATAT